jgi:hypothetical protein
MKKWILVIFLAAASTAAQTGCTVGGGVGCSPNLNLWLLPPHYQNWGIPWNANATAVDTLAGSVVLYNPTASQKVTQPSLTYTEFNAPFVYGTVPVLYFGVTAGVFDAALTRTGAGAFSLDGAAVGGSTATLSLGGLIVNGSGGTVGKCLGSNGTVYNTSVSCTSGSYQTVNSSGTSLPQEAALNFRPAFTVTDDPSHTQTTIGINKVTLTLPTSMIAGNTCLPGSATFYTATLNGVVPNSTFSWSFTGIPNAVVGWGATGGMVVNLWPDASALNQLDWSVCNQTATAITPGAMGLNVGVN